MFCAAFHYESFIKQHEIFISSACRCFIIANMLTMRQVCADSLHARFFVAPQEENFLSSRLFLLYEHIR